MAARTATRDAEALALRARGWTHDRIANEMGYSDRSGARKAVERAIADSIRETTDEAKTLLIADLNAAKREAWEVLEREHVAVSGGRVVRRRVGTERDEDGNERLNDKGEPIPIYAEVPDHGPVLDAIDRVVKIDQELAKIYGAYAPTRSEVITLDAIDAEIRKLEAEIGHAGADQAGAPPASA